MMEPSPVPMTANVQGVKSQEGHDFVLIQFFHPAGAFVGFIPLEGAEQIAQSILAIIEEASRNPDGLIIPTNGQVADINEIIRKKE